MIIKMQMLLRLDIEMVFYFCVIQILARRTYGCGPVKADIILLIDESGSVGSRNFPKQLNFLSSLVDTLPIGSDAIRIGAVTFSDEPVFVFGLENYTTSGEVKTAISNINYNRGGTDIVKGIEYIRYNVLTPMNGDRPEVKDYIILITDGVQEEAGVAGQAAMAVGITIFVVGIGNEIWPRQEQLTGIVTPNDHHYFYVRTFDDLTGITVDVASVLPCPYYCGDWSVSYADTIDLSDNVHNVTVISGWELYSSAAGEIEIVVWRPNGVTYEIVGSNTIQIQDADISTVKNFTVPIGERISISSGDRIGWYCSGPNLIPYTYCNVSENENCPQSTLMTGPLPSFIPGTEFDWTSVMGTSGQLSDRAYALKFYTTNNTAPTMTMLSSISSLPDTLPIGTVVLAFNISDPDEADAITYSLSHEYFAISTNQSAVVVNKSLPSDGSLFNTTLTLTAVDTCYNTATISIPITVISQVPVIKNLPRTVSMPHLKGGRATIFKLDIMDTSVDSVCCTLSSVRPPSNFFTLFRNETGYFVNTSTITYFDHRKVNSYRLTICCEDGTTTTKGTLQVDVRRPRDQQVSPSWMYISISLSMMPVVTAFAFAVMILVATF